MNWDYRGVPEHESSGRAHQMHRMRLASIEEVTAHAIPA